MKKSLLTACVLSGLTTFSAQSQITIDSSDFGSIGDTVFLGVDSMPPGMQAGPSGFQTWDFSSLLVDYYDSLFFLPATDPNFPASNLAVKSKYATPYYILTANDLSLDGVYITEMLGQTFNFAANYENNQQLFVFPATYQNTFTDIAKIDTVFRDPMFAAYVDSVRILRTVFVNSVIDGYGFINTPGESDSAIRQYRTEITIDTLCFKGGIFGPAWTCPSIIPVISVSNPIIDSSYIYTWWAKGKKYPLLELRTDNTGDTVRVANFIIGNKVTALPGSTVKPLCYGSCNGQATVLTLGGVAPMTYLWDAPAGNQTTQTATGLCAGSYSVTVIDAVPDTSTTVAVINEPAVVATNQTSYTKATCDTCQNGAMTVTGTGGTPGYTYLWSTGAVTDNITGILPGTYTITVTDSKGCSATSTFQVTVGIDEILSDNTQIKFYPNPVKTNITFSNMTTTEVVIEISDYTGRIILETVIGRGVTLLPVYEFKPGLYLVKVKNRDSILVHTGRIAIMR